MIYNHFGVKHRFVHIMRTINALKNVFSVFVLPRFFFFFFFTSERIFHLFEMHAQCVLGATRDHNTKPCGKFSTADEGQPCSKDWGCGFGHDGKDNERVSSNASYLRPSSHTATALECRLHTYCTVYYSRSIKYWLANALGLRKNTAWLFPLLYSWAY